MNQRIQKLAEQAKAQYCDLGDASVFKRLGLVEAVVFKPEDLEKFAELFVQECVEQLRYTVLDTQELRRDKSTDYQVGWEDGMFDAEEMIKEHFGVES